MVCCWLRGVVGRLSLVVNLLITFGEPWCLRALVAKNRKSYIVNRKSNIL